jgi:hypothetical protein
MTTFIIQYPRHCFMHLRVVEILGAC